MLIPREDNTELLFPVIVQHREYGHADLNDQLLDLVKSLQQDASIGNRVTTSSITTVGGYQPDMALHRHCADNLVWRRFVKEIVRPSVEAYMVQHRRHAGWPAPETR